MNQLKSVLLIVFSTFFFVACKKEKASPEITKENISGTYMLKAATATSALTGSQTLNLYDMMLPCEKDDEVTLKTDFTVLYADAGIKCEQPGDDTGTWNLAGNIITLDGETATVEKFDGSTLIITSEGAENGISFKYTSTFSKKR